jgi:hypothetical protein
LFRHVARVLGGPDPPGRFAVMADHAEAILTAAAARGYRPCAYTEEAVRRQGA